MMSLPYILMSLCYDVITFLMFCNIMNHYIMSYIMTLCYDIFMLYYDVITV